jgi:hypothetical protein
VEASKDIDAILELLFESTAVNSGYLIRDAKKFSSNVESVVASLLKSDLADAVTTESKPEHDEHDEL